eukprot:428220-Pelagomonas_calceolata.AAC.2
MLCPAAPIRHELTGDSRASTQGVGSLLAAPHGLPGCLDLHTSMHGRVCSSSKYLQHARLGVSQQRWIQRHEQP